MDKKKLISAGMWFCGFSTSIIFTALVLSIGFNSQYGNNIVLTIGLLLLIVVFYCAYKGIKLVLEAIFR